MAESGQVGHYTHQTIELIESTINVRIGTPLRYE